MSVVLVLADTHVPDHRVDRFPAEVLRMAERADVVLHAGDVTGGALLDRLGELAPVHAVLGNNDHGLEGRLPERLEVEVAGVSVAMVHDAGPTRGRPARLARWFPDADVVVFGHSHEPVVERSETGTLMFNPGSPTQRRRQPNHTVGLLRLADGRVVEAVHLTLPTT